ncbi:MAG: hypothetical protein AAGH60_15835 [Pseudomonadota bacterium]
MITITGRTPMISKALPFCFLAASVLSTPSVAQTVEECDFRASAQALVEFWNDPVNSQTFAGGTVRLAITDVIEPAAGSFHLVVLSPPFDELGGRQCRVVSADGAIGFRSLSLAGLGAVEDAQSAFTFTMEAGVFNPNTDGTVDQDLTVSLDTNPGVITAVITQGK